MSLIYFQILGSLISKQVFQIALPLIQPNIFLQDYNYYKISNNDIKIYYCNSKI